MRKLSVAIVGLGKQGRGFLRYLIKSDRFCLKAVCDTSTELTEKIKVEFMSHNVKVYNDQTQLYRSEKLDCVVLALPHDQYLNSLELASSNNVDVLKEKPFARNLEESHEINDIVKYGGIKLMIACQFRYDPLYLKIKDLLNEIGPVYLTKCYYTIPSRQPNSMWRSNDESSGGGVLLDIGYHLIDLILWYFGKPIVKHAQSGNNHPDLYSPEDTAFLSFNFSADTLGDLFVSCVYPHKNEGMTIIGKNGAMYCMNGNLEVINSNHQIIDRFDFSDERSKATPALLEAFANLCSRDIKYYESDAFIHHMNHMSIMNDAYQIINREKKL